MSAASYAIGVTTDLMPTGARCSLIFAGIIKSRGLCCVAPMHMASCSRNRGELLKNRGTVGQQKKRIDIINMICFFFCVFKCLFVLLVGWLVGWLCVCLCLRVFLFACVCVCARKATEPGIKPTSLEPRKPESPEAWVPGRPGSPQDHRQSPEEVRNSPECPECPESQKPGSSPECPENHETPEARKPGMPRTPGSTARQARRHREDRIMDLPRSGFFWRVARARLVPVSLLAREVLAQMHSSCWASVGQPGVSLNVILFVCSHAGPPQGHALALP